MLGHEFLLGLLIINEILFIVEKNGVVLFFMDESLWQCKFLECSCLYVGLVLVDDRQSLFALILLYD